MKKNRQKGLALIFTLALMLILSAVVAGSFLGMSGQQRLVQQSVHRLELESTTRSIMDRGHKFFVDYIISPGGFPPYDTTSLEVYTDTTKTLLLKDSLESWFTGLQSRDPETTRILSGLTIVPGSLSVKQAATANDPPSALDAWRRYEITAKMKDTATGTEHYGKQSIRVSCGGLFDFIAFFDGDLEINAGPTTTIQGPLFSNGNIFLMTNSGNTLNLKMPAGNPAEKYILRSAKNIYYYFKRAIAQNYFLVNPDPARSGLHSIYKTAAQNIREQLSADMPYPGYGEKNGLEIEPYFPTVQDTNFEKYYVPFFYYFANSAAHGTGSVINLMDSNGTTLIKKLAGPFSEIAGMVSSSLTFANGAIAAYNKYTGSASNIINMSTAWDVRRLPQPGDGWSYEDPVRNVTDGDPAVNPMWNPAVYTSAAGDVAISVNVPRRSLPFGDTTGEGGTNANHNLIEPLQPGDSDGLKALKLEYKADILIKCSDAACTSHTMKNRAGTNLFPACGNVTGRACLTWESFYDYRLGGSVRGVTVDIEAVTLYVQGLDETAKEALDGQDKNGLILYIETKPIKDTSYTSSSVRIVRLKNGRKGPVISWGDSGNEKLQGFTIATNGRLWIQGDFNTWTYTDPADLTRGAVCSYSDLTSDVSAPGHCSVPPGSIFSDSVGLLSNNWSDTYGSSTALLARPAATEASASVNVYAALVTGYLYSQLVPNYPACLTNEINAGGCSPYPFLGQSIPTSRLTSDSSRVYYVNKNEADYYGVALGRPDNKWPQWAKDNPIPAHVAGPAFPKSIIGYNKWEDGNPNYYDNVNGYTVSQYYPPGETAPVATPPFPGIRMGQLQQRSFFGPSFFYYRCPGVYKRINANIAASTGSGETTTGSPATTQWQSRCCVSSSNDNSTSDLRTVACPEQGWQDQRPCGLNDYMNKYPIDSEGFLTSAYRGGATLVQFAHDATSTPHSHYQVQWTTTADITAGGTGTGPGQYPAGTKAGWPAPTAYPSQPTYEGALVYLNRNPYGVACYQFSTGDFLTETRDRWPVVKAADGKFYFLYDNAPYTCSKGVDDDAWILQRPYSYQGVGTYSNCPVTNPGCSSSSPDYRKPALEPVLRPNMSPGLRYWAWYYQPLYTAKYSGGLENIINLQEDWQPATGVVALNFSGVLTSPWSAEELIKADRVNKAFYDVSYYQAPTRNFDYNELFLEDHPPGTPGVYGVVREKYDDLTGE